MTRHTVSDLTRSLIAATLLGMVVVGGSVWAKGSSMNTGTALRDARIDVQMLSLDASSLPAMTIEQAF